jgi:hypothetical protein
MKITLDGIERMQGLTVRVDAGEVVIQASGASDGAKMLAEIRTNHAILNSVHAV